MANAFSLFYLTSYFFQLRFGALQVPLIARTILHTDELAPNGYRFFGNKDSSSFPVGGLENLGSAKHCSGNMVFRRIGRLIDTYGSLYQTRQNW